MVSNFALPPDVISRAVAAFCGHTFNVMFGLICTKIRIKLLCSEACNRWLKRILLVRPKFVRFSCGYIIVVSNRFLQGCHTLVTREVVSVGLQVLQALAFLHTHLLLHKDVATRNCV